MAATFLAFGAAVQEAGLSPGWALLACWGIYGMPGQLVLVQAAATGWAGGVGAAVMGAVAVNARFLPMAVSLAPVLSVGQPPAPAAGGSVHRGDALGGGDARPALD